MTKLNKPVTDRRAAARIAARGPIVTNTTSTGPTHQGGPGFGRDERSELFLLAVTNLVGEHTFYEPGGARDQRYAHLIHTTTGTHPEWTAAFLRWLRHDANMRTASIVGATEFAKARLAAGEHGMSRQVVDSVLVRADEPGEMLGYWTEVHGRAIPKPVKRGVADAVERLYTPRNLLKYDTASHGYRFADVIDLVHPDARDVAQGVLYMQALERRHGRPPQTDRELLPMLAANDALRRQAAEDPAALLDSDKLAAAGMTWEDVLSLAGSRVDKAKLWAAIAPSMGYMSQLRNLRNFDEAGLPDEVAASIAARLADPGEVTRSRQLPMRFLSAYRAVRSDRWRWPLDQALTASLANVPRLPGRTLILVDTSGSMHEAFSKDGTLMRWDAAVVFGLALALRAEAATVVSFSDSTKVFTLQRGESLLRAIDRWRDEGYFIGSGTSTGLAVTRHQAGHDRVVVLTDEQAGIGHGLGGVFASVPAHVPAYTWNLAGYRMGHAAGAANRHVFGGLTDAGFRMIPLLEAGGSGHWPWETPAA